jgi:hypothetical protein
MGGGRWSDDAYEDRVKVRSVKGTPTFAYSHSVSTGATPKVAHSTMDPASKAGAKSPFVGAVMRESRDSDDHPESLAIGVLFDETGSMGGVPVILQKKLASLMKLLIAKGYAPHPQILFGAIGDAYSDKVPLQIGQFESDVSMDDNLTSIYLEGNGGGTKQESYELGHYFFARHTSIDCFEKRGKKGYFFTIGDEGVYDYVHREHVKKLIGDDLAEDLPTEQVIRELMEKYNVFHIIAEQGGYPNDAHIEGQWKKMLGERVLKLEDSGNIAELIALTIGLCEGTTDIDAGVDDLKSVGTSASAAKSVRSALVPFAAGSVARAGSVSNLPAIDGGDAGGVTRL